MSFPIIRRCRRCHYTGGKSFTAQQRRGLSSSLTELERFVQKESVVYPKRPPRRYTVHEAVERLNKRVVSSAKQQPQNKLKKLHDKHNVLPSYLLSLQVQLHGVSGHKFQDVIVLPHGTGRHPVVVAVTTNPELAAAAHRAGAVYVGDLRDAIATQSLATTKFQRVVCIKEEMEDACRVKTSPFRLALEQSRKIPTIHERTLVDLGDFLATMRHHANGQFCKVQTSSPKGMASVVVGQYNVHTPDQVAENVQTVLQYLYNARAKHRELRRDAKSQNNKKKRRRKKWTRHAKLQHQDNQRRDQKLENAPLIMNMQLGMMGVRSYPLRVNNDKKIIMEGDFVVNDDDDNDD